MTTRVTDDFAGTGALSGSWTVSEGTFARTAGEAGPASDAVNVALYTGDSPPNDQYAFVVLGAGTTPTADEGIGPVVRATSGSNMYFGQVNTTDSRIYRRTGAGTYLQLGSTGVGGAAGETWTLEITGSAPATLVLKQNGVARVTTTDSSFASGSYGMWDSKAAATATAFEGGDFVSASPALPELVMAPLRR